MPFFPHSILLWYTVNKSKLYCQEELIKNAPNFRGGRGKNYITKTTYGPSGSRTKYEYSFPSFKFRVRTHWLRWKNITGCGTVTVIQAVSVCINKTTLISGSVGGAGEWSHPCMLGTFLLTLRCWLLKRFQNKWSFIYCALYVYLHMKADIFAKIRSRSYTIGGLAKQSMAWHRQCDQIGALSVCEGPNSLTP